jgi:hypothetical protein
VISGNIGSGIVITGVAAGSDGNRLLGNFIGTDAIGTAAIPNTVDGIHVFANQTTIGGAGTGAGNVVAFNGAVGVNIAAGIGNTIRANAIFANGGPGIDLAGDGVTPNDAGDGDTGANNLQNFPVLTSARLIAGTLTVNGTLNSAASSTFGLDFYTSASCDSSGNGQGTTYLGATTVTTDGAGNASFTAPFAYGLGAGVIHRDSDRRAR